MSNFIIEGTILKGVNDPVSELVIPQTITEVYGNKYTSSTCFQNCLNTLATIKTESNCALQCVSTGAFFWLRQT